MLLSSEDKLKAAQQEMLSILLEIDRICRKYHIKYWLVAGTLLGAIRHNGFIPWDDDCDIGMMRKDFERFQEVLPTELPQQFFLQTKKTDPQYPRRYTKIRSNRIKLIEHDETYHEPYNQGVSVDIFIHDFYQPKQIPILVKLQEFSEKKKERLSLPKNSLKRHLWGVLHFAQKIIHINQREKLKRSALDDRSKESAFVGFALDYHDYKAIFRRDELFPIQRQISFEGRSFFIPYKAEKILEQIYGDYLTLPPLEKRRFHAKDFMLGTME